MEANNLLEFLKKENGLCPEGVDIFKASTNSIQLVAHIAKKWVEVFIEHESAADVAQYFNQTEMSELNREGIFINQKVKLENADVPEIVILVGKCDFEIKATDFKVSRIYVLGDSRGKVSAEGYSILTVDAHHRANVEVSRNEKAVVNLYNYGAKITSDEPVQEKEWRKNEIFNYKW